MARSGVCLLLVVLLLALPACQMNERLSGTSFGAIGGAALGGLVAESVVGALVGGVAGGVVGYIVGDYLADRRERMCCPAPAAPCAPTVAPQDPVPYGYGSAPCAQPYDAWAQPPAGYPASPQVGGIRERGSDPAGARAAIARGRGAATLPEAEAAYREAVRLDPGSADAWNALGLARLGAGDPAGAEQALRRALALDPRHYAATRNLALAGGR